MTLRRTGPATYRSDELSGLAASALRARIASGRQNNLIVLSGPTGTGKTHDMAAMALSRARLRQEHPGRYGKSYWVSCSELYELSDDERATLKRTPCGGWAFLDDVGSRLTPGTLGILFEVLDYRVSNGLVTVCTMNLPKGDTLDERILSRLRGGIIADYSGLPDRRNAVGIVIRNNK